MPVIHPTMITQESIAMVELVLVYACQLDSNNHKVDVPAGCELGL